MTSIRLKIRNNWKLQLAMILSVSILLGFFTWTIVNWVNTSVFQPQFFQFYALSVEQSSTVAISPIVVNHSATTFTTVFYSSSFNGTLYMLVFEVPASSHLPVSSQSPVSFPPYHVYYQNGTEAKSITGNVTICSIYPVTVLFGLLTCPSSSTLFVGNTTLYHVQPNTPLTVTIQKPIGIIIVWYIYNASGTLYRVGYSYTFGETK